jgi:hypothetical protein
MAVAGANADTDSNGVGDTTASEAVAVELTVFSQAAVTSAPARSGLEIGRVRIGVDGMHSEAEADSSNELG